jgi:hypothetical protein
MRGIAENTKIAESAKPSRPLANIAGGPEISGYMRANYDAYRVSGMFKLFGWNQCPRADGEKMQAALSKPPKVLYHLGPRGRAGRGSSHG